MCMQLKLILYICKMCIIFVKTLFIVHVEKQFVYSVTSHGHLILNTGSNRDVPGSNRDVLSAVVFNM